MFNGFFDLSGANGSLTKGGRRTKSLRATVAALIIALASTLVIVTMADARLGGGGSFGSRGSRTFSMPSATPTAPSVSPFQRSATPYGGFTRAGNAGPGFFGSGFGRGLLGGFLGAGLFGLLFGNGLMGGLGGGMSLIGLLLQLGLLYLGVRLVMNLFANRQAYNTNSSGAAGAPFSSGFGASGGRPQGTPIAVAPEDYQTFERRLIDSQTAYSNGDIGTLQRLSTPEMAGNFEQELRDNDRHGVVNRISDVRLLQGDLSEAWREQGSDYATVAMRFSLVDATMEKGSGRLVAGNAQAPQEVTEVWTFRRPSGSGPQGWALSGIQQT